MRIVWLLLIWLAAVVGVLLLALLVPGFLFTMSRTTDFEVQDAWPLFVFVSSTTVGASALVVGAILATVLRKHGLDGARFLRATAAIRTNAAAWVGALVLVIAWTAVAPGDDIDNTFDALKVVVRDSGEVIAAVLGFGAALLLAGNGAGEVADGLRSASAGRDERD